MKRMLLLSVLALPALAAPISPKAIEAHMRFLADDLLQGREPGTPGFDIAANYVAAQFASIGLQTQMQPLTLRAARLIEEQSSFALSGQNLAQRKDVLIRPNFLQETSDAEGTVVFAGFGIVAPELKHDDYASLDARGKFVLVLSGAPSGFPNDQRAYYSGGRLKERIAAEHGAIGVLMLNTPTDEKRYSFEKRAQQSSIAPMLYLDGGRPADAVEGIRAVAQLSRDTGEKLFAGAPAPLQSILADAEKGVSRSFPLTARVTVHTVSQFSEVKTANVVGILRGADPKLRDQYVAVSAHLDHLGNHPPAPGADGIYNGAYDNASGIACLIEIARAMRAAERPRRSVIFVAFTAEEKGDQGSEYFAHHPPVRGAIVADVNMDMFLMLYPVADLVALGGEHTTIGPLAARAAQAGGFTMSPDPYPEEVRFIRSDQFSFVETGVPAIHLKPGNKSRDPNIDGAALTRDWLRRVYHSPADDMQQKIDFDSGARYAAANLRLVTLLANQEKRPAWKRGDFFGETFERLRDAGAKARVILKRR